MENKITIIIQYENNVGVQITERRGDDTVLILKTDENSHFDALTQEFKRFGQSYCKHIMDEVANEMNKE